jgi:hypothetical protein
MAWSNLKAFPQLEGPVAIASALREAFPEGAFAPAAAYSASEVAAALRASGVYPSLSPLDLVTVLTYSKVFPDLTLEQSRAALGSLGIPADVADKAFKGRPQELALS